MIIKLFTYYLISLAFTSEQEKKAKQWKIVIPFSTFFSISILYYYLTKENLQCTQCTENDGNITKCVKNETTYDTNSHIENQNKSRKNSKKEKKKKRKDRKWTNENNYIKIDFRLIACLLTIHLKIGFGIELSGVVYAFYL